MALIKCPECGKEISDRAASCPNCGFPIAQGSSTQEPPQKPKEYDIEMLDSMRIKASKANIEVYYKGNLLLEANPMDFVLNYDKEEPDDLGRVQLKVAFSIPKYAKPFKICMATGAPVYKQAKQFTTEIAERYFKKKYVAEWYMIDKSVMNSCEKGEVNKTKIAIENIERATTYSTPEPQYTPQSTTVKKKKKGSFSNYLALACAIFIAVYTYSSKPWEKNNTTSIQHKKTENSYEEKTITPTPIEYIEVSVNRMMAELESNALSASEKYEDQYLEITGKLDVIDSSGKYISLHPDNKYSFVGVQCYIKNNEQKQKVSSMAKGDIVTLKGKCTMVGEVFGYSLDIDEIE